MHAGTPSPTEAASPREPDSRVRVLFVEDNPDDATSMIASLAAAGLSIEPRVESTRSGLVSALAEFSPAIVISDFTLPDLDGTEVTRMVREWDPSMPVVMVSALLGEELAVTAIRSGAADYVVKRRLDLLAPAIRRALAEAGDRRERHRLEIALQTLAGLKRGEPIEATADRICRQVASLSGMSGAWLYQFGPDGEFKPIGTSDPAVPCDVSRLPAGGEALQRADAGPWVEPRSRPAPNGDDASGQPDVPVVAVAPVRNEGRAVGFLEVASAQPNAQALLSDSLGSLAQFAGIAGALLGPELAAAVDLDLARRDLRRVIDEHAFRSVFQPIVDLESGEQVGFEALTRFDSGEAPDLVFGRGWEAGIGQDLELAAIRLAIAESTHLPAGTWLHVNVAPTVLLEPDVLREALVGANRPIVLEVTEHEAVADYQRLREAIRSLGWGVRLAVDDAGAGSANFSHLIELSPDLVKLDLSLVRDINSDLGRQAIVVALHHFSRKTGCRLIAEGVETEAEAETLRLLGAEFAQGYLYGKPAAARSFATPERAPAAAEVAAWAPPTPPAIAPAEAPGTRHRPAAGWSARPGPTPSVPAPSPSRAMPSGPATGAGAAAGSEIVKVAIVSGQALVAQAVASLIGSQPGMLVAGVAMRVAEATALLDRAVVDVVICDIEVGDESGFDLLSHYPGGRPAFVMYSLDDLPIYHRAAFREGAAALVLQGAPPDELVSAVRSAAMGRPTFSATTLSAVRSRGDVPTATELEVLVQMAEGKSNSEIAGALGISPRTVDGHVSRMFQRSGAMSRTELVLHAVKEGWIRPAAEVRGRHRQLGENGSWIVDAALKSSGRRDRTAARSSD